MLKVNKNITLNGNSEVNGIQVVYMSASISTDGNSNASVSKSIVNQEVYMANKVEVRADMDAFEEAVYKVEDELIGGTVDEIK